jgi:hypothetical protein
MRQIHYLFAGILASFLAHGPVHAQDAQRFVEAFPVGRQYHVSCRVEISGSLTLPPDKPGGPSRSLSVTGNSAIEYDERILRLTTEGQVDRTLRLYRRIDFQRQVGDRPQESTIRPEVRRLVVLRQKNVEVPFSPDGPLTWGEMDLVRTDVFTPALNGLLGDKPVAVGDRWTADSAAVQELTDMERIDEGQVNCRFDEITLVAGRRVARVSFAGTVRGLNEDGPNRQQIDGYLFFDLDSRHVSYLSLRGVNSLLGADGKASGRIEGRFVLTRRPPGPISDLDETAVRGVNLEPNEDNTLLLYDNPEIGIRFLYPRRWHVAGVRGFQVTLDESGGNGILITREAPERVPTAEQFLAESRAYFEKQNARVLNVGDPRRLDVPPRGLEQFSLTLDTAGRREFLDYYIARQRDGGATLSARLVGSDVNAARADVARIAKSVEVRGTPADPARR